MSNDIYLHAIKANKCVWLGLRYRCSFLFEWNDRELSGKQEAELNSQQLLDLLDIAMKTANAEYLQDRDEGGSEIHTVLKALAFIQDCPNDTFYFSDDHTERYDEIDLDKETFWAKHHSEKEVNYDTESAFKAHVSSLEVVVKTIQGYLAVELSEWEKYISDWGVGTFKARRPGIRNENGGCVYVFVNVSDWPELASGYTVSDC